MNRPSAAARHRSFVTEQQRFAILPPAKMCHNDLREQSLSPVERHQQTKIFSERSRDVHYELPIHGESVVHSESLTDGRRRSRQDLSQHEQRLQSVSPGESVVHGGHLDIFFIRAFCCERSSRERRLQ